MKKYSFVTIIFCVIGFSVYAQKVRVGMHAGMTMGKIASKYQGEKESTKLKPGVTAGISVDIPVGKHFSIQPGANFLVKGGKDDYSENGTSLKQKMSLSYFEFPVHFLYNSRGAKGNFFAGAGLTGAFGMSGKVKFELNGEKSSENIYFGYEDDDDLKTAEIGGSLLAGYTLPSGITFSAGYNMGINSVSNADEATVRTSYFMLRIGWLFK